MDINQYTRIPFIYDDNGYIPQMESKLDIYTLQLDETIILLQRESQRAQLSDNVSEDSNTLLGGEP